MNVSRFIIIQEQSNQIVATTGGTHDTLERLCTRLDRQRGGTYFYDDATNAAAYTPQDGPNVALVRA